MPNIYGEDHAVQISSGRDTEVSLEMVSDIESSLKRDGISVKAIEFEDERILVRVPDSDTQLAAREALDKRLGDDYFVAMNLAPDTPDWLDNLGGTPMKLGLDLRGGVHFLMEVDMNSAINTAVGGIVDEFRDRLREEGIRYRTVRQAGTSVDIIFRDADVLESAQFFLRNTYPDMVFDVGSKAGARADCRTTARYSRYRKSQRDS